MKRMKHPLHGYHDCYDSHEEARMRANGWVEDTPEVKAEPAPQDKPKRARKVQ